MLRRWRFAVSGLAFSVLAACSGGNDPSLNQTGLYLELRQSVAAVFSSPELPVVTRELLDSLTIPSLEVVLDRQGQTAYMLPLRDNGDVRVWNAPDFSQVVTRNGIVIQTRGVGDDLMSSRDPAGRYMIGEVSGRYTREMFVSDDTGARIRILLSCTVTQMGFEDLVIVERVFPSKRVREICRIDGGRIVNEYWVSSRDSRIIWKSRQWLGPQLGFVNLRLLKE